MELTKRYFKNYKNKIINSLTPGVTITANAMKEDKEKCKEAGMSDHISNPIDIHSLIEAIDKWE